MSDLEDFKKKIKAIDLDAVEKKKNLSVEYSKANNPYKIGDIIQDHCCIIQIIGITHRISYESPLCYYTGHRLKKNLEPFQSGEGKTIYQESVKKLLTPKN